MNMAITDGLTLMPPVFANGLEVWANGDGTPGSTTLDGVPTAAFVPADADFAGCLEIVKLNATEQIRYMGETPYRPGMYLRVTARVKAMSGNLPNVRIAAWAGDASLTHVAGLVETGPSVALAQYGEVVEVSAIIGSGQRGGVDMVWGTAPAYAHIGLDLTGPDGGVVRIDDLRVEDVTVAYLAQMLGAVDVRDYGAVGDGVADDSAAFAAADAAAQAQGGEVLISAGRYRLESNVSLASPARFVGTVEMPASARLTLTQNFNLPAYADAFGDETEGFRRALQALFNFADHDALDMGGRNVDLTAPIDVHAVVGTRDSSAIRRVIRNGSFYLRDSAEWADTVVTSQASYSASDPKRLSNVADIANVPVGALVTGAGVGREVYVTSKNVGAATLELSAELHDAVGTQSYTFRRFKYALDFSGFSDVSRVVLADLEFQCNSLGSAVMLPPAGLIFHVRDCFFSNMKDRGITSTGRGCQGMLVDRCQFLSREQQLPVSVRETIAINVNANDTKIRDNRAVRFRHFVVSGGAGHIYAGNHWFQDDHEPDGIRTAGLVLTNTNVKMLINGNYIDNSFIEWTNEHDAAPEHSNEYSFGGLTIVGNIFTAIDVAPWFSWLVVKPYGAGHYIHGLNVTGNTFKSLNGSINRVEKVDDTLAALDMGRCRNLRFEGNLFTAIDQVTVNPVTVQMDQATDAKTWVVEFDGYLPFDGRARNVENIVMEGEIRNAAGDGVYAYPFVRVERGTDGDAVEVVWPEPVHGRVHITGRVDAPN